MRVVAPEVSVYRPNLAINHHNRIDASRVAVVAEEAREHPETPVLSLPSMPRCAVKALNAISRRAWALWAAKGEPRGGADASFTASRAELMDACGLSKDLYYSAIAFLSLCGYIALYNTGYSGGRWTCGRVVCLVAPEVAGVSSDDFSSAAASAMGAVDLGREPVAVGPASTARKALTDAAGALWRARERRCGAQAMAGLGADAPEKVADAIEALIGDGLIRTPEDAVTAWELYCADQDHQGVPVAKTAHLVKFLDISWPLGIVHYLSVVCPPDISPDSDRVLERARKRARGLAAAQPHRDDAGGTDGDRVKEPAAPFAAPLPGEGPCPEHPLDPSLVIDGRASGPISYEEVLAASYWVCGCGAVVAKDFYSWMEKDGWTRRNGTVKVSRANLVESVHECARRDHGVRGFSLDPKEMLVVQYPDQQAYEAMTPKNGPADYESYNLDLRSRVARKAMEAGVWPVFVSVAPDAYRSVDPWSASMTPEQQVSQRHAMEAGIL